MTDPNDSTVRAGPDRARPEPAQGQTSGAPAADAGQGAEASNWASTSQQVPGDTTKAGSLARFVMGATMTGWDRFVSQASEWDDASQQEVRDPFIEPPNRATTARHVALGLMIETGERVERGGTRAFQAARRATSQIAGRPARRAARSRLAAPARRRYDALLMRGERQVRQWAVRGQIEEARSRELFKAAVGDSVDASIDHIAHNPQVQELVETQSENLAREVVTEVRERGVNADLTTAHPFDRLLRRPPRMVKALLPPDQKPVARRPQPPPNLLGEPAGFGSRFLAFVTDAVFISVSLIVLLWLIDAVRTVLGAGLTAAQARETLSALHIGAIALPGTTLYAMGYLLFFWTVTGQTPGKMLMGLRVLNSRGGRLSFGRALVRSFGYLLSTTFFYLGFLWVLFDRRFRGWHDLLAGSQVVYTWKAAPDEAFLTPWTVSPTPKSTEPQAAPAPNQESAT